MPPTSIGIIETGRPPADLETRFGTYPSMFQAMLGRDATYTVFDAVAGELPAETGLCEAYVITGSPAGVYDDLPWIAPLIAFLQRAKGKAKLVGICFGHQIMAQAFGGEAVRSEKGLGLGLHRYTIVDPAPWMDDSSPISIAISHQDQVVTVPAAARVVGGSDFAPNGILAYLDQPAISFQCHPEFEADFAVALVERQRERVADTADQLIESLTRPSDRDRVAGWIRRFLEID